MTKRADRGPDIPEPDPSKSLLLQISTQSVQEMKRYFGKGPTQAKSYFIDDVLIIIMRGGLIRAERTLLDAGFGDNVRQFRQVFENVMADRLTYMVERLTGRHVITYQSQVLFEPDMIVELFVFDDDAGDRERQETASAVGDPNSPVGLAHGEDVESSSPSEV
jgi:uncharacterized protein YbcI